MTDILGILVAMGLVIIFGLPAACLPGFRGSRLDARLGLAFLAGAIVLTAHAVLLSTIGLKWTVWTIALPLLISAAVGCRFTASLGHDDPPDQEPLSRFTIVAIVVCLVGVLCACWLMMSSRYTSSDLLFFWGVKGVLFADAGGIDPELLGTRFFKHAHVTYPPLVPVLYSWITLVCGDLPWRWLPTTSFFWVAAAAPVIRHLLRLRLSSNAADLTSALWTASISASLLFSRSGGDAEGPLVAYLAVACAASLDHRLVYRAPQMAVMMIGIAGACLTKNEGRIAAALLIVGFVARDLIRHRIENLRWWMALVGIAVVSTGGWLTFLALHGLPIFDPVRERAFQITFVHVDRILAALAPNLGAGTAGIVWIVIAIGILFGHPKPIDNLPLLTLAAGLVAFVGVYYLHSHADPTLLISWTLRRLIQPVLSAGILWAGASWFSTGIDAFAGQALDNEVEV